MNAKSFADFGIQVEAGARGEVRACCPQCSPGRHKSHEKCLAVNVDSGVWLCHHCGWAGGLGGPQQEARARQAFSLPRFSGNGIADATVLAWFARRGISLATLEAFHIAAGMAWMPGPGRGERVNTVQFPYFLEGRVVNVKYRTADKRFRQEKNARKCLYNYDMALAEAKAQDGKNRERPRQLVVTEGEMDCLALYEAGLNCVVSVPDGAPTPEARTFGSKFSFLDGMEPLFEACGQVVLAVDNDAPGQRLRDELCRRIGMERCLKVLWPEGCKDANDVLMRLGPEALSRCVREARPFPIDGVRSVPELWDALFDLHAAPEKAGADIGWKNAEGVFNVEPGQLTVVTGIPSHGKSTFIDALRVNLFRQHGWPSAAFSPENWPAQNHLSTLVEMYAGENFRQMTQEELYAHASALAHAFFFIQPERDMDMMHVDAILQRARALVYREGIKVLVIDPWNEIEHDMGKN